MAAGVGVGVAGDGVGGGVGVTAREVEGEVYVRGKVWRRWAMTWAWAKDPGTGEISASFLLVRMGPETNFPSSRAVKLAWSQSRVS